MAFNFCEYGEKPTSTSFVPPPRQMRFRSIFASDVSSLIGANPYTKREKAFCAVIERELILDGKLKKSDTNGAITQQYVHSLGLRSNAAAATTMDPAKARTEIGVIRDRITKIEVAQKQHQQHEQQHHQYSSPLAAGFSISDLPGFAPATPVSPSRSFSSSSPPTPTSGADAEAPSVKLDEDVGELPEGREDLLSIRPELLQYIKSEAISHVACEMGTAGEKIALATFEDMFKCKVGWRGQRLYALPLTDTWILVGRIDGALRMGKTTRERQIVEAKCRLYKFYNQAPIYDRIQIESYLRLTDASACTLVEHMNENHSQIRVTEVAPDNTMWNTWIVPILLNDVDLLQELLNDHPWIERFKSILDPLLRIEEVRRRLEQTGKFF